MDIYTRKSRWKIYLALCGLIILVISLFYTNYLADRLADGERDKAKLVVEAFEDLAGNATDLDKDITFQTQIMSSNTDIPTILVNKKGKVDFGANFGEELDGDLTFLEKELEKIKKNGLEPFKAGEYTLYYKQSRTLTLLTYFPVLQLLLLGSFIVIGYMLFSSARRSEQNQVWAGMAKETAHQLGTPISAIVGWIEHLKAARAEDEEVQEVLEELNQDVDRLNLIADRFSKIGSAPELKAKNVYEELDDIRSYMERRSPRKVTFDFPDRESRPILINVNRHLFAWVLENLMRNALDAMGDKGQISATVAEEEEFVSIELSDTGKGIPPGKFKTVFEPGFTTKKRGWGLGLSLAKRIIVSYHSGRIFVKKSGIDMGTTFCIKVPKNKANN